jgi:hypothetical protein
MVFYMDVFWFGTEMTYEVQRAVGLDVVVGNSAAVLQLDGLEDEAHLLRGNALLFLDLGLDGVDGVGGFNLESDGLAGESPNEHSHFYSS